MDVELVAEPDVAAAAPEAAPLVAAVTTPAPRGRERTGRPDRGPRPEVVDRVDRTERSEAIEQIGASGERLTRDEAFDLIRRSVMALTEGDETVRAGVVRAKARELLARDSESLSDRNFPRILKDAHDGDVIDLRRRGDDFEIARAAEAESVAAQLARSAVSNAPPATSTPAAPRGMGPRGVTGGRGRVGRPGAPPADLMSNLLSIGVVGPTGATPSVSHAAVVPAASAPTLITSVPIERGTTVEPSPSSPAAKPRGRKPAAKKTADAPVAKSAVKKSAAAKKSPASKSRARKTVARADA